MGSQTLHSDPNSPRTPGSESRVDNLFTSSQDPRISSHTSLPTQGILQLSDELKLCLSEDHLYKVQQWKRPSFNLHISALPGGLSYLLAQSEQQSDSYRSL